MLMLFEPIQKLDRISSSSSCWTTFVYFLQQNRASLPLLPLHMAPLPPLQTPMSLAIQFNGLQGLSLPLSISLICLMALDFTSPILVELVGLDSVPTSLRVTTSYIQTAIFLQLHMLHLLWSLEIQRLHLQSISLFSMYLQLSLSLL